MKSPLKEKPLRLPGQSLDEEIDRIYDDKILVAFISILFLVLVIGHEWFRSFYPTEPSPIVITIVFVPVIFIYCYHIHKYKVKIQNIKQGRDGERIVGQYLEGLRADGCIVFHDILGPNFNIDHVIVSQKGVFTIETKTWSKRSGEEVVRFDGRNLIVNGRVPERDPIVQSMAEANWLKQIIRESTGRDLKVHPVIVFPGWWVDPEGTRRAEGKGIWLLNPKALPTFLNGGEDILTKEDTNMIVFHLSRYIQSFKE